MVKNTADAIVFSILSFSVYFHDIMAVKIESTIPRQSYLYPRFCSMQGEIIAKLTINALLNEYSH